MDRNVRIMSVLNGLKVALRKESVDRNATTLLVYLALIRSLSARRAWIEILMKCQAKKYSGVALRKESVDRNLLVVGSLTMIGGSLSARRAWIEMVITAMTGQISVSSLSARRAWIEIKIWYCGTSIGLSRSPQGERG